MEQPIHSGRQEMPEMSNRCDEFWHNKTIACSFARTEASCPAKTANNAIPEIGSVYPADRLE